MSGDEVQVRLEAMEAAALHQMTNRLLEAWEGEEGNHVDLMVGSRRSLESALRSVGWAPNGDGAWTRTITRRR